MPISEIVDVTITADIVTVSRTGFGTPLLLGVHTIYSDLIREYSEPSEMVADGFPSHHPLVKMAEALVRPNPRPSTFKVGKATAPANNPTLATGTRDGVGEGDVCSLQIYLPNGTVKTISYTLLAAETYLDAATELITLIDAETGVSAASLGPGLIGITPDNLGEIVFIDSFVNITGGGLVSGATVTDYAAAIDAILLVDDDWYAVTIDQPAENNLANLVAKVETLKKISVCHFPNDDVTNGIVNWLGSHTSEKRSGVIHCSASQGVKYPGATWLGDMLPRDPGSATWAFKSLEGVEPTSYTTADASNILSGNGNIYQRIAGNNLTRNGTALSGQFLDITRSVDWLEARIAERVFALIIGNDKLPYTDASVDLVRAEISAQLELAIDADVLRADPAPVITAPKVADVDPVDRAARLLPDVKFSGELAGAIHKVEIRGSLSV